MNAAAAPRVFIIDSHDSAEHSGPAGLPDWFENRPRRSRAPCSACFIRSRSGIANSFKSQSRTVNECRRRTGYNTNMAIT